MKVWSPTATAGSYLLLALLGLTHCGKRAAVSPDVASKLAAPETPRELPLGAFALVSQISESLDGNLATKYCTAVAVGRCLLLRSKCLGGSKEKIQVIFGQDVPSQLISPNLFESNGTVAVVALRHSPADVLLLDDLSTTNLPEKFDARLLGKKWFPRGSGVGIGDWEHSGRVWKEVGKGDMATSFPMVVGFHPEILISSAGSKQERVYGFASGNKGESIHFHPIASDKVWLEKAMKEQRCFD